MPVAEAIVGASSVPEADPQQPVVSKGDHASVVVRGGLIDREQDPLRVRSRSRSIIGRGELGDDCVVVAVDVVHVEQSVRSVVGVKCQTEQALFAGEVHPW